MMRGGLERALAIPCRDKRLLAEALIRSAGAWISIRLTPYNIWRSALGTPVALGDRLPVSPSGARVAADVAKAHARIATRFRGWFTCLMLALSARDMLAARGVASLLVLGVRLHDQSGASAGAMGAHAWVVCGEAVIVGEQERAGHTPVAAYVCRHPGQSGSVP